MVADPIPPFSKAYRAFLKQEDEGINETIRHSTSTGRPLGSEKFIKKLEKMVGRDLFPKKGGRPKRKK